VALGRISAVDLSDAQSVKAVLTRRSTGRHQRSWRLGNVGTAAAIANAVFNATGVRVRDLPIRLEKLLV
jgi:hypothetical protein